MAVRVTVPPTLSSTASFGSGSWYTTERILQSHTSSRPFVVMLRSLCCFSGQAKPHHLQPWPFELRCKPPTLKYCKLRFRWYTTEKDPARAIPFKTFVVMLRRSLCCFCEVRRNYTTLQPWPFELQCKPPTLSSTASLVQVAGILLKGSCKSHTFKTFVVMLRRSLCFFREVRRNHHSSTMAVRVTVQATDAFKYCKLRFR
jgi:hypothetical protein